jgi:hypothetical protein
MENLKKEINLEFSDEAISEDSMTSDEIPKEERNLRTQAYDKSISDVVTMMKSNDIVLDPDYQRNYIWDNKKASLLIESILLNVPIPIIYVSEEEDSTWSVIDGLQRLNSLLRYFNGEFKLAGLEVLRELNGCVYSRLNPKASRILRNGILRIILIFKESHPEIKYEIFMRLNRGAIQLNEQELRNCLYRGKLNDLLKQLRTNKKFLTMVGLEEPHKRMIDAEIILRYFTISESYDVHDGELKNYTGQVKSSLNKYLQSKRHMLPLEIDCLRQKFETTIEKVYDIFGSEAFQKINDDDSIDPRLNRAIMDFVMVSFEHIDRDKLMVCRSKIRDLLRELPLRDPTFNDSISSGTSDKKKLEYRLNKWNMELTQLIK